MRDVLVAALLLCGSRAQAECTAETLRSWKPGNGSISADDVREEPEEAPGEPRHTSVKCATEESDEACESRARKTTLQKNPTWTLLSARIEGVPAGYEAQLEEKGAARKQKFATVESALE